MHETGTHTTEQSTDPEKRHDQCSRCSDDLEPPVEAAANYVTANDFVEPEPVEVVYGLRHTDETKQHLHELAAEFPNRDRQALAAEMAHPNAPATREVAQGTKVVENDDGSTVETADTKEVDFSIPVEQFEKVEVDDPHIPTYNDNFALTLTEVEEREVQKTGLVCPDCTRPGDDIMWGPDAE